jgi:hypothetical protein
MVQAHGAIGKRGAIYTSESSMRARDVLIAATVVLVPALGAGAAKPIGTFEDMKTTTYRHTGPDFTLQYPYDLRTSTPSRKGEVFSAAGAGRVPALNVLVLPRPPQLSLAQAAQAAAKQLAPNGTIKAQHSIDLGGVPGEQVTLDWSMPVGMGVDLRSTQVSAFQGDDWVIVTVTDGRVGDAMPATLRETADSLRFKP